MSNETVFVDPNNLLEKYCAILGIKKQSYAVIKENISSNKTGHNPSTILGAAIYNYCKVNIKHISLDKIAETLSISPISIRRYLKIKQNES